MSYEVVYVPLAEFRASPSARLVDPDALEAWALIDAGGLEAFAASDIAARRGAAWCAAIARRTLDEWRRLPHHTHTCGKVPTTTDRPR